MRSVTVTALLDELGKIASVEEKLAALPTWDKLKKLNFPGTFKGHLGEKSTVADTFGAKAALKSKTERMNALAKKTAPGGAGLLRPYGDVQLSPTQKASLRSKIDY